MSGVGPPGSELAQREVEEPYLQQKWDLTKFASAAASTASVLMRVVSGTSFVSSHDDAVPIPEDEFDVAVIVQQEGK